MPEKREKQTIEEFRQFFTRFLKDHRKDPDLAPELMLDGALSAFEAVKKMKLDLSDDERKMFEKLAADPELVKSKEKILGGLVESLRAEVRKLGNDRRRLEECVGRIKNEKEECGRVLGEEHQFTKEFSELLLGVQKTIIDMDKRVEEVRDVAEEAAQSQVDGLVVKLKEEERQAEEKKEEVENDLGEKFRKLKNQRDTWPAAITPDRLLLDRWRKEAVDIFNQAKAKLGESNQVVGEALDLIEEIKKQIIQTEEAGDVILDNSEKIGDEAVSYETAVEEERGVAEDAEQSRVRRVEYIGRLKQDLVDLQMELADSFAEKEKKSGLWGKITGGKKKSEAKYEHYLAMYKDTKEKLIEVEEMQLSSAMKFLQEQEKGVRARIKEKYQGEKENFVSKTWRKMGDCNIYNLFEKKAKESPDSWWAREFKKWGVAGKVGGKMLSLRFGVSMGLAGLGIYGPGMATQSEAFILARSSMVGLGTGFGSRGVMDRVGQWIGEKKLKKVKDVAELGKTPQEQYGKLSELMEEYEGYAVVNKVDLSKNSDYARLAQLREQVEIQLLEQKREAIGAEDADKLLDFLNNQEAEGLDKLARKIGSAKTKRWIKRGVSVTLGAALGVFTNICLTAKAAREQASQAYFALVEGKQKALEAAQEAQAHAIEQVGVAPVETAPAASSIPPPVPHEISTMQPQPTGASKATEAVIVAKVATAVETPSFEVDLSSEEFRTMASELRLSHAGMDYMDKMTERFPQLKDAGVLEKIWRAGELGDHSRFKHEGIYDAVRNFDTHIKTAGAFKFEVFQAVLDKAGVDEATEYLKLFKFNEHSLSNLGIDHADKYSDAKLTDKIREIVAAYKNNGDTKAGRHVFEALRHHENRFIGNEQLPVKGVEKGVPVRVLGANEFTDNNQIIVEQAKKGARALHIEPTKPALVAEKAPEGVRPADIGISEDAHVKVAGKVPEGLEPDKIKVKNIVDIVQGDGKQSAAVVLDDGRVFSADLDVAYNADATIVTDVLLNNLQPIAGQEELLHGLAGVAKDSDLVEMAKFYPGSSKADLARGVIEHARGGGGGVVRAVEAGKSSGGGASASSVQAGRVLITPEVVPGKHVPSGGTTAVSEHARSRGVGVAESKIKAQTVIEHGQKPVEPQQVERATPDTADKDVAKLYEQPAVAPSELLPDTASFEDMEKAIDGMDWSHADMKKAKIFVRFMEMQQKLLDDNASGLRKMLTDIVGDNVDTEAGKGWITRKVLGLLSRQKNVSDMIVNGINKHRSIAEIQKQLSQEMFIYDQAAGAEVLPDAHNPNNLADYNRYAHGVLAREFDDSNVEMEALLQQTQAMGKHGGVSSK